MAWTVGDTDVLLCPVLDPDTFPPARYTGLQPGTTVLQPGHQRADGHAAWRVDTIFERDVEVPMRDGTVLRADVFRPAAHDARHDPVPLLLAWSPYGKTGTGFFTLDAVPGRVGVPQSRLSGYEKFEGVDPADWTARGYAVCNIDTRGAFDSGGDLRWFGSAEGRDGYDAIEHLATRPWCNGSVALVGNSWLAVAQWFIAAEQPPHLACIAPWEGASDFYRELLARGGVPSTPFVRLIQTTMCGRNRQEDVLAMLEKYPEWNEYWADKRVDFSKITAPTYILGSFSTGLHTEGAFRAFEEIQAPKWLRVHPTQEWYDLYDPESTQDLQRFLDRYTKGIENGWEKTPRARVSIIRYNAPAMLNHDVGRWPVPNTRYEQLCLHADRTLSHQSPMGDTTITYQSDVPAQQAGSDTEEVSFEYTFAEAAYLVGYSKAVLYVSCASHDEMDIFVQLRKADRNGHLLEHLNISPERLGVAADQVGNINSLKYLGPSGIVRASRRQLDEQLSTDPFPVLSHRTTQKVTPGDVVRLDIGIWPTAIFFDAGEKLILKVAGHNMVLAEFEPLQGSFTCANKGQHALHIGAQYQSMIQIPLVDL